MTKDQYTQKQIMFSSWVLRRLVEGVQDIDEIFWGAVDLGLIEDDYKTGEIRHCVVEKLEQ
jgi:hypothetical protein